MSTLTPMFDKKTKLQTLDDHIKKSQRKPRKDKKKQLSIPVTEDQRLIIGRQSLKNGFQGETKSFLAELFNQAVDREFIIHAKSIPYCSSNPPVFTRVNKEVYEKIVELKVEWGLRSVKQAAHRILINEMGVVY